VLCDLSNGDIAGDLEWLLTTPICSAALTEVLGVLQHLGPQFWGLQLVGVENVYVLL